LPWLIRGQVVIDWERITQLRNEIGAEDFGEVIEIFLEEVEAAISGLKEDAQPVTLESRLHFLKGSALNLGFADFAAACHAGEKHAAAKDFDQIKLSEILTIYDRSRAEFLKAL
jgi:HPt (histidine-containing phosphotransfer) domain-containing protein